MRKEGSILHNAFVSYHPTVNFLYFGLVLLFSMCLMHPVCLGISLFSSFAYALYLGGRKTVRFAAFFMLPMLLMAAVINPAFNHKGITVLAYLPTGNPLTLESILYGLAAAVMLTSVVFWFSCYNQMMTSDKLVYLFGRILPSLSLMLSMSLRFVPKLKAQLLAVTEAQRAIGRDPLEGSVVARLKKGITVLSILITWSLENAIETADSMKGRGYGLPGRTAFSIYHFDARDKTALFWLCACGGYLLSAWAIGGFAFRYFPSMQGAPVTPLTLSFYVAYFILCMTPLILNKREDFLWKQAEP